MCSRVTYEHSFELLLISFNKFYKFTNASKRSLYTVYTYTHIHTNIYTYKHTHTYLCAICIIQSVWGSDATESQSSSSVCVCVCVHVPGKSCWRLVWPNSCSCACWLSWSFWRFSYQCVTSALRSATWSLGYISMVICTHTQKALLNPAWADTSDEEDDDDEGVPCQAVLLADTRSWAGETVYHWELSDDCWCPCPLSATAAGDMQTWTHTHIRSEQTETHWVCLHTCKCLNCVLLQGEGHRGYWHSVSLFNVRSNFDIRKMWNAHDFSRKHGCLAVAETECVYLRLKASRCVLSSSSPLSIMVRLEWASFSRLADAIIKLSIHLLMNSCSFSRPVLPAVTHTLINTSHYTLIYSEHKTKSTTIKLQWDKLQIKSMPPNDVKTSAIWWICQFIKIKTQSLFINLSSLK